MFARIIGFTRMGFQPRARSLSARKVDRSSRRRPLVEELEKRLVLDITDGLVVHLTFDGDVLDHSGHSNNGTIVRPPTGSPFVPAIIRQGFQTSGLPAGPGIAANDFITLGRPADLDFTGTDFSFSWWGQFQPSPTQDEIPWLSNKDWTSGGLTGWVLASGDTPQPGQFKWNYRALGEPRHDSPLVGAGLDDNQWHHYVVTFASQGDGVAYLDGTLVDDRPLNSSGIVQDTFGYPTNIFQDGTGDYTDSTFLSYWNTATIADLGIWRRVLTPDDVTTIYTKGMQGISAFDLPGGAASPGKGRPEVQVDLAAIFPGNIGQVSSRLVSNLHTANVVEVGTDSNPTSPVTEPGTPAAGASMVTDPNPSGAERMTGNPHFHSLTQATYQAFHQAPQVRAVDTVLEEAL